MKINICDLLGVRPQGLQSTPFVTSWCLPLYLLASIRLILSIYSFTAIAFSFKWFADHTVIFHLQDIDTKAIVFPVGAEGIRQSFSYFTYLTFWGLAFYFFFASMHTLVYARRGYAWLDNWPRYMQAMHSVYYSTIVCYPFLVTTVYWGSMWTRNWWRDDFSQWNMITMHAMNSVFAAFEIVVTETNPLPIAHLAVLLLIMSLYLGVAYITKVTEGIYIYLWLDPNNGIVNLLLHTVGYAALLTGFFFMVRLAIGIRCRLVYKRRQPSPLSPAIPIVSKRASKLQPHSSSRNSGFWTYERYEMETLREEKDRRLRLSCSEIRKPEAARSRPQTGHSYHSQATTVTTCSPRVPEYDKTIRYSYDCGWPLVTQPLPHSLLVDVDDGGGGGRVTDHAFSPV